MANTKAKRRYGVRESLIAIAIMAVILAIGLMWGGGSLLNEGSYRMSGQAPEIEFEMPTGKQTSVKKLKGQTLLLNFWASWCGPCMAEMPSLRMLEEHLRDRGFILLAFNISESREQLRGRFAGTDMPDNLIFNFNKEFLRPYGINAIPISVLIDSTGVVHKVYSGPQNWLDMRVRREIEKLLK